MVEKEEGWLSRQCIMPNGFMVIMIFLTAGIATTLLLIPLQEELAECQETCGSEQFEKDLERDLLFYHDTNRGLHFLDDVGCEWRIVIEPATAYVNCLQAEKEAKKEK